MRPQTQPNQDFARNLMRISTLRTLDFVSVAWKALGRGIPYGVGMGLLLAATLQAQDSSAPQPSLTLFPHSDTARYYASGQANIIFQANTPFHSPYEDINSLQSRGEYKTSMVGTLYLAAEAVRTPRYHSEAILDFETAAGRGISEALGLAGFTNLDVVRNPSLGSKPYLARVSLHQTIGLTDETEDSERTQFSLATKLPVRRIELRLGKMSLPDFLDLNTLGSDSHLQFMNWTVDNNGAWDYAADTRGYTYAGILEYDDHAFTARYAIAAMPTTANGIDLDWAISRASGQNWELELRKSILPKRKGTYRLLGFVNHANMGTYREAIDAFLNGTDATPTITAHRHFGAVKYGVGVNFEQEITDNLRVGGRFGWNEGQHESFAYTEVDQTFELVADYTLTRSGHPNNKIGLAFTSNAIKRDHQEYLRLGGLGFLIGDGNLNYGRENILESYYNVHAWRGLFFALDMQGILNPGYNRDRGPVWVPSVRTHVDF